MVALPDGGVVAPVATVAVIVQNPFVPAAVYTDEAVPDVAPVGTDRTVEAGAEPQVLLLTGVTVKLTMSPLLALVTFVIDTDMVSFVPRPTVELAGVTVTTDAGTVWDTTSVLDAPVSASVALTVQVESGVPEAVVAAV
jgi:hypothetical protein